MWSLFHSHFLFLLMTEVEHAFPHIFDQFINLIINSMLNLLKFSSSFLINFEGYKLIISVYFFSSLIYGWAFLFELVHLSYLRIVFLNFQLCKLKTYYQSVFTNDSVLVFLLDRHFVQPLCLNINETMHEFGLHLLLRFLFELFFDLFWI